MSTTKMRNFLIQLILYFLTIQGVYSQDWQKEVEKDFNIYSNLLIDKKYKSALNYVNEKIFTYNSRAEIANIFSKIMNMDGIQVKISMPRIIEFQKPKEIDNINYVKFKIVTFYRVKFLIHQDFDILKEDILKLEKLRLEHDFGIENVSFNEEYKNFNIKSEITVIANYDIKNKHWRFIGINEDVPNQFYVDYFPMELLK